MNEVKLEDWIGRKVNCMGEPEIVIGYLFGQYDGEWFIGSDLNDPDPTVTLILSDGGMMTNTHYFYTHPTEVEAFGLEDQYPEVPTS